MNRRSLSIVLILAAAACGGHGRSELSSGDFPAKPLRLPACFRLSYEEWGLPPHADGVSLRNARAPIGFQLRADRPPRGSTGPSDSGWKFALWLQESDDTLAWRGIWKEIGEDSVEIEFPFMPGLYGMVGTFVRRGDILVGSVRTYSDALGTKQGDSRAVALPLPCSFPPIAPDPFAEESAPQDPPPPGAGARQNR